MIHSLFMKFAFSSFTGVLLLLQFSKIVILLITVIIDISQFLNTSFGRRIVRKDIFDV